MSSKLSPCCDHYPGSQALCNYRCRERACQEQCLFINLVSECAPNNRAYCGNLEFFVWILIFLDAHALFTPMEHPGGLAFPAAPLSFCLSEPYFPCDYRITDWPLSCTSQTGAGTKKKTAPDGTTRARPPGRKPRLSLRAPTSRTTRLMRESGTLEIKNCVAELLGSRRFPF